MDLDDKDFKQIEKALINTSKGVAVLMVEGESLRRMLDDPSFAHRRDEIDRLVNDVDALVAAGKTEAQQIRDQLVRAKADHMLDRTKQRIADTVEAMPKLKKWLKRLLPQKE